MDARRLRGGGGRLPWAGTVEWGERFGVDGVRRA